MRIKYEVKRGNLHYEHHEEDTGTMTVFVAEGFVPKEIVKKGKQEARAYAEADVERQIAEGKERFDAIIAFRRNPDVTVSIRRKGIVIEGKIVFVNPGRIDVELVSPPEFKGRGDINFGYASAIAGHRVFDDENPLAFSKCGLDAARTALGWTYDRQKYRRDHAKTIALAKELNR